MSGFGTAAFALLLLFTQVLSVHQPGRVAIEGHFLLNAHSCVQTEIWIRESGAVLEQQVASKYTVAQTQER